MNIPIYRAKRKDNGEWVEGYLAYSFGEPVLMNTIDCNIFSVSISRYYEILPETISIHFPDMLDKNGERIFAALNESCIGGSLLNGGFKESIFVCTFVTNYIDYIPLGKDRVIAPFEVTGIYEGTEDEHTNIQGKT